MFKDKHISVQDWDKGKHLSLADYIPVHEVLDDNKTLWVQSDKKLALTQVIAIDSFDYQGRIEEELEVLFNTRNQMFAKAIRGLEVSFHCQRKQTEFRGIKENHNSLLVDEIVSRHNSQFQEVYSTEWFIVVSLNVEKILSGKLYLPSKTLEKEKTAIKNKCTELSARVGQLLKMLEPYAPEVLQHEDKNSPLLGFWSYLINGGKEYTPPAHKDCLASVLSIDSVYFPLGERYVVYDEGWEKRYAAFLSIKAYPDETTSTILSELIKQRVKFNMIQHVRPIDKETILDIMKRKKSVLKLLPRRAALRVNEVEEAEMLCDSEDLVFVGHTFQLIIFSISLPELEASVNKVKGLLNRSGITLIQEGFNRHAAYFGQYPLYHHAIAPREFICTTANVSDTITFEAAQEGLEKNPFGNSPIAYFPTSDQSTYAFNFHPRPTTGARGHTFIVGDSGSGKTMLMNFLLASCKKYNGKSAKTPMHILAFDRDNGMKIPTIAFGGKYIDIGKENMLSLNPMRMRDTAANRTFLKDWIGEYLAGGNLTEEEKAQIEQAIVDNFELEPDERSLHAIRLAFGNESSGSLMQRMKPWLPDEEGQVMQGAGIEQQLFNGEADSLSFNEQVVAFEMKDLLSSPDLTGAFASYIFKGFEDHIKAISQRENTTVPHICFVDEMPAYLGNPVFAKRIEVAMNEWRKRGGVFVGAVQDASQMPDNDFGKSFISNCETLILFPNPKGDADTYIRRLGLNEEEFAWIRTPNPKREVMIKQSTGSSVIINVDLSHLGDYMPLLFSGAGEVSLAESMMEEKGLTDWVEAYLVRVNGGDYV